MQILYALQMQQGGGMPGEMRGAYCTVVPHIVQWCRTGRPSPSLPAGLGALAHRPAFSRPPTPLTQGRSRLTDSLFSPVPPTFGIDSESQQNLVFQIREGECDRF